MIRISLRDITSKGLEIHRQIPKEGIGLTDEEVDIQSPLDIHVHVSRVEGTVFAEVKLSATFGYLCARCLEPIVDEGVREYDFTFEIGLDDEFVDVGEEIRQELIVENPTRILCQDNCQGICRDCGVNLNKEKCQCKQA